MSKGYVYVLSNPSIPGQLKIGRSKHGGSVRAKDLSAGTGLATPYEVEWQIMAADCHSAEYQAHTELAEYRLNSRREFFACDLNVAISTIMNIVALQYEVEIDEERAIPAIFEGWGFASEEIAKRIINEGYLVPDFDVLERAAPWLFNQTEIIVERGIERGLFEKNPEHRNWRKVNGNDALKNLRALLEASA